MGCQKSRILEYFKHIRYGKDNNLGSHNVQGMKKLGKREMIEEWMGKRNIKIAGVQETHQTINSVENRKNYKPHSLPIS